MTIIKKIGPFYDGDRTKGEKDFERANSNLKEIDEAMGKVESVLKKETGYSKYNLPETIDEKVISLADCPVTFTVRSEMRTTKRPQYKEAVLSMERYLSGIIFHLSRGRTITGVAKENSIPYIGVEKLRNDFDILAGGILEGGLEQTITYRLEEPLISEGSFDKLEIPENPGSKTRENFIFYVRADKIKMDEENYVKMYKKDYEKDLKRKKKIKEQVSDERKVIATKKIVKSPDWPAVVKTIVTVPVTGAPIGELDDILSLYESHKLNQVRGAFPWYDLIERDTRDKKALYVSIPSVDQRIVDLKEGLPKVKWKRYYIESRPL